MIEAVKFWNEPNNKSHWDLELDPHWSAYAGMVKLAADAVRAKIRRSPVCSGASRRSTRPS
jgi:hypothetical protein